MSKEAKKTKPNTVRFNIEKLELLMTNENITSFQSCVDFLLDKYWWETKIGVSCNSNTFKQNNVEPKFKATNEPIVNNDVQPIPLSLYETYKKEFDNARSADDVGVTLMVMKKDTLTSKEKIELEAYATKVFNDKGFYHD